MQLARTDAFQHRLVGRRRTVEGDLAARQSIGPGHLLLGLAGNDEGRIADFEILALPARFRPAPLKRRQRHLAQVFLGGERVDEHPVGHFAGHLGHQRPHRREKHPGRPVFGVGRREKRRHQRVPVELAGELQRLALVPVRPDGAHGQDELPHTRRRVRPRHAEALGDMRPNLRAEAEHEAALRGGVQVMTDVGERHGRACERHRDGGHKVDFFGGLGRHEQREERVVPGLRAQDSRIAHLFQSTGFGAHLVQLPADAAVYLHRVPPRCRGLPWPLRMLRPNPRAEIGLFQLGRSEAIAN